MASDHHPQQEPTPSEDEDRQQAELFAASAAESAITGRKDPPDSTDLNDLTISSKDPSPSDPIDQKDRVLSKEQLVEEALNCPCLASMRDGPCGDSFLTAYRCFLESETDPKGMDCMEQFKGMQTCIADNPEYYNLDDDDDDADPFVAQKSPPPKDVHELSTSSSTQGDPNPTTSTSSASS